MVASQPKQRTISTSPTPIRIVMAADDRNEHLLVLLAANETGLAIEFTFVDDGAELLEAMNLAIILDDLPDLVLLALDPTRAARDRILERLDAFPELQRLPIVAVAPSTHEHLDRGDEQAGCLKPMPTTFSGMIDFVRSLAERARPQVVTAEHHRTPPGASSTGRRDVEIDITKQRPSEINLDHFDLG